MKNTFYLIAAILGLCIGSCNNQATSNDSNLIETSSTANYPLGKGEEPILTFEHETWNFGTMSEGEVVEHDFSFTNTGKKPLLISDVQATCGCTIPEWPREPIRAGQGGVIKIRFNSAGKHESINKDVTIFSNANPIKKQLTFTAFVNKKTEGK